jgi:hypothetical protein
MWRWATAALKFAASADEIDLPVPGKDKRVDYGQEMDLISVKQAPERRIPTVVHARTKYEFCQLLALFSAEHRAQ